MSLMERLLGGSERFRRNVFGASAANLAAQFIGLASLPLLSRLYAPEQFAILAAFTLVHGLGLALATFRVEWLVPNSRSDGAADRLVAAGMLLLIGNILILLLAGLALEDVAAPHVGLPAGQGMVPLLAAGLLAGGLHLLLQARNVRRGRLAPVNLARLVQAVTTLAVSVALGFMLPSGNGLVLGYVCGLLMLVLMLRKDLLAGLDALFLHGFAGVSRALAGKRRLMSASTGLALANTAFLSAPTLLLILFYDDVIVGWYGLVFRVATAPIGIVTTAVNMSFWADAADLARRDPDRLWRFYLGSVKRLSILAALAVPVFLAAPLYIPPLFGREEWSGAGHLMAAITPFLVGMIVFSPTTHLMVYGKQHWQLWADLAALAASVLVFAVLARAGQPAWIALLGTTLVMLAGYGVRFSLHRAANLALVAERGQ